MSKLQNLVVIGLALAGLGACAQNQLYQEAQSMSPSGSEFDRALYHGYFDQATKENQPYGKYAKDTVNRDTYAQRAMAAARGQRLLPEQVGIRNIPGNVVSEARDGRDRLMTALEGSATTKVPGDAANAQVMFDCWLEQLEENYQPNDIAACRSGFYRSLEAAEAAIAPPPTPLVVEAPPFLVFFDWDEYVVTPEAMAIIARTVQQAKKSGADAVQIIGHTDSFGATNYNSTLSKSRADAVRNALASQGIAANTISVEGRGESDPLVSTGNGVREPQNRRAQGIWIYD